MRLNFKSLISDGFWDKTGALVSWLCAVHCLAMPFIISFLPLLGISFLAGEGIEYIIVGISVAVALISFLPAYFRQHRKIRAVLLFVSGICFVIFADLLFEESLPGKFAFVLTGASLVTSAHFINRRLCRNCQNCDGVHYHSSE